MKDFFFGNDRKHIKITATDLPQALKIFKITVLFPEQYVEEKYIKSQDYSSALGRNIITLKKGTDPVIIISEGKYWNHVKPVGEILLSEALDPDLQQYTPDRIMIAYEGIVESDTKPAASTTLPIVGDTALIPKMDKTEMRAKHDEILQKKAELEKMVDSLRASMDALHAELKRKADYIYAFETFLGVNEHVYQLAEGVSAPEDEPLAVYQQVLYMDEEIGVWADEGIDFTKIDLFDAWIKKNYIRYLYKPKSVCAFQIRRHSKDYKDPIVNLLLNEENRKTYFLIRNGQNLYRIWGGVHVDTRMFPARNEYEQILAQDSHYKDDELKRKHKNYMIGLLYLQGLIERTPILGNSLSRVNLLKGKFTEKEVLMIRDDEPGFYLTDGRPTWNTFLKANQGKVKPGMRVILTETRWYSEDDRKSRWRSNWRTAPFRAWNNPSNEEIFVVDSVSTEADKWAGPLFTIYYESKDDVGKGYESKFRERRVPFRFYRSECINFDAITLEDCEYYLQNRLERPNYLRVLPILVWVRRAKRKEAALEAEFVKLVLGVLGWGEERAPKVQDAISWWKLKNRIKRGLLADDAKALRMIVRRLQGQGGERAC